MSIGPQGLIGPQGVPGPMANIFPTFYLEGEFSGSEIDRPPLAHWTAFNFSTDSPTTEGLHLQEGYAIENAMYNILVNYNDALIRLPQPGLYKFTATFNYTFPPGEIESPIIPSLRINSYALDEDGTIILDDVDILNRSLLKMLTPTTFAASGTTVAEAIVIVENTHVGIELVASASATISFMGQINRVTFAGEFLD